ncbi:MAG: cobalamin biosynthesis protein, partial [Lachnospiraceae bacterium]|nr:cobalamin biosynthesis protein [Lachnospiraceae bacterium]
EEAMEREGLDPSAVCGLASIDLKSGEPGLCSLAEKLGVPFFTYTGEELAAVPGAFTESEFVRQVTGVGSVCERAAVAACREASEDTRLLMKKYARDGVTVAAACFIPELFKGSER